MSDTINTVMAQGSIVPINGTVKAFAEVSPKSLSALCVLISLVPGRRQYGMEYTGVMSARNTFSAKCRLRSRLVTEDMDRHTSWSTRDLRRTEHQVGSLGPSDQ
jgi:hypothetical protein